MVVMKSTTDVTGRRQGAIGRMNLVATSAFAVSRHSKFGQFSDSDMLHPRDFPRKVNIYLLIVRGFRLFPFSEATTDAVALPAPPAATVFVANFPTPERVLVHNTHNTDGRPQCDRGT